MQNKKLQEKVFDRKMSPFSIGKYAIFRESPSQLQGWSRDVEEVEEEINRKNLENLEKRISNKDTKYITKFKEFMGKDNLSDEEKRILAIGTYYLSRKVPFQGRIKFKRDLLLGGETHLDDVFNPNSMMLCTAGMYAIQNISESLGIPGEVEHANGKTGIRSIHSYFVTDSGLVIDPHSRPYLNSGGIITRESFMGELGKLFHFNPK